MAEKDLLLDEAKEEFTEDEVVQGMNETATGIRKVHVSGLGDLVLRYPSREDELEADFQRSKAYTRFLLEGLKTNDEMERIAEERGLWTRADEDNLARIQQDMVNVQLEIHSAKSEAKKKKYRKELLDLRNEFLREVARKNAIFAHTVEHKAQNVWWGFLVFRCTYLEDGKTRLWASYQDFLNELNSAPSNELMTEFISFYNGLSDNFFDLWLGEGIEPQETGD